MREDALGTNLNNLCLANVSHEKLGSLSKGVSCQPEVMRSPFYHVLTLLSFLLLRRNAQKIGQKICPRKQKGPLSVDVLRSKALLLKLPTL